MPDVRQELGKKLEEVAPYVGAADFVDRLREALKEVKGNYGKPIKTSVGKIVLLGMWQHADALRVQFNDLEGNSYPSDWKPHLFKIAKEAYFRDLRMVVLSEGDPVGPNILVVSLVHGI